ncbi:MAG: hypothetical protein K6B74_13045, partial [Ruminococcus sp.]|nr:hypothetical protein [Ruminococcus sp.]
NDSAKLSGNKEIADFIFAKERSDFCKSIAQRSGFFAQAGYFTDALFCFGRDSAETTFLFAKIAALFRKIKSAIFLFLLDSDELSDC